MGRVRLLAAEPNDKAAEQASQALKTAANPKALSRMRSVAETLQARSFGLFTVLTTGGRTLLLPLVTADPAGDADAEQFLVALRRGDLAKTAMSAATPAIWLSNEPQPEDPLPSRWTRRLEAPAGCTHGVVFPIDAERCGSGLAAFMAPKILSDAALCAAHMECFAMFEEMTRAKRNTLPGAPKLSKRELECLKLTADGLTSDEIANRLGLSVHTANQYLANTAQKLNAVNRMHAVAKALRAGLFD